jgi:hypothetical protein
VSGESTYATAATAGGSFSGRSVGWYEQLERGPRRGLALFTARAPAPGSIDLRINPVRVTHDLELGIPGPGLPFPMHTKVRLVRPSKASSERLTTLYRRANNI